VFLLRSLTDAVLHHLEHHRLHVIDIDSLTSTDELSEIAAKAMVIVIIFYITNKYDQELCAAPPSVIAGQYTTLNCIPLLVRVSL